MEHDLRLEGLVMKATTIPGVDFKVITQKLSENIDKCRDRLHTYRDIYCYVYNGHLNSTECENFISMFDKQWTLEETNLVAKKLDYDFSKKPYTKDEFRVAMHLIRSRIDLPMKESDITVDSTAYGRLADHYLSTDGGTYKLIHEYFHRIK